MKREPPADIRHRAGVIMATVISTGRVPNNVASQSIVRTRNKRRYMSAKVGYGYRVLWPKDAPHFYELLSHEEYNGAVARL